MPKMPKIRTSQEKAEEKAQSTRKSKRFKIYELSHRQNRDETKWWTSHEILNIMCINFECPFSSVVSSDNEMQCNSTNVEARASI